MQIHCLLLNLKGKCCLLRGIQRSFTSRSMLQMPKRCLLFTVLSLLLCLLLRTWVFYVDVRPCSLQLSVLRGATAELQLAADDLGGAHGEGALRDGQAGRRAGGEAVRRGRLPDPTAQGRTTLVPVQRPRQRQDVPGEGGHTHWIPHGGQTGRGEWCCKGF